MKLKYILLVFVLIVIVKSGFGQTALKVMTFNVRYDEALFHKGEPSLTDWANRKLLQVKIINTHQPDVIGMQEPHFHQVKYLAEQLPAYKWFGVGRADGKEKGEFNPIFYRKDKLTFIQSGTFWLSETPEKVSRSWDSGYDRICTWVLFENKKSKVRFYVYNTHFDSKGKNARVISAKLINDKLKTTDEKTPVFVLGDFNFLPESIPYKEISSKTLTDSRTISELEPVGPEGTFNSFRYGATHKHRIDFIFVNEKVKVKRYEVINYSKDGVYPSDHFPVLLHANIGEK